MFYLILLFYYFAFWRSYHEKAFQITINLPPTTLLSDIATHISKILLLAVQRKICVSW